MLLMASDVNDCCWSFILRVDKLSIIFISSVVFACRKLFSAKITLKMLKILMFSE